MQKSLQGIFATNGNAIKPRSTCLKSYEYTISSTSPLSLRLHLYYRSWLDWAALAKLTHFVDAQVQTMMGTSCEVVECGTDMIRVNGVCGEAIKMPVHVFGQRLPISKRMAKMISLAHGEATSSKEMIRHFTFCHHPIDKDDEFVNYCSMDAYIEQGYNQWIDVKPQQLGDMMKYFAKLVYDNGGQVMYDYVSPRTTIWYY